MIPIYDDNSDRNKTPVVNYFFLIANIVVFIFYQKFGADINFTLSYATVPAEIMSGRDIVTPGRLIYDQSTGHEVLVPGLGITPLPVWLTLITSMFMHGGIAHLGGNMLYLWVFGDNLENKMGHIRFFFFYLLCGLIASLTHVFSDYLFSGDHLVPSLGASGAISGILGGYLLLFPLRRVTVFFIFTFISVPAFIVLGSWILLQIVNGYGFLGGDDFSGIAYAAHIGGFIAGFILIKKFLPYVVPSNKKR